MANSLDTLSSGLIGIIGEYFAGIRPSSHGSTGALDGDRPAGLIVLYSGSGLPLGIGTMRNRRELARLAGTVPGSQIRTVEVGDEALASNLARLIADLFGASMPFGIIGPERPAAAAGAVGAQKRRGRKPGSKNKGTGRKRGRPARAAAAAPAEATPKRRGRRPKSQAAGATKRGPGRPRKNASAGETPVAAVKRGPGRPRRNQIAGEAPVAVKRGPGRPPKNAAAAEAPAVKRGPGRPRKNPIAGEAPKRRGRPPGKRAQTAE